MSHSYSFFQDSFNEFRGHKSAHCAKHYLTEKGVLSNTLKPLIFDALLTVLLRGPEEGKVLTVQAFFFLSSQILRCSDCGNRGFKWVSRHISGSCNNEKQTNWV